MARTAIPAASIHELAAAQPLNVAANAADITFQAGDNTNGNETPCTGKDLLLVNNTDAAAQTVTIDAAPDDVGRDGSISAYSVGAGELAIFGPFPTASYRQTDGMLHIDVSAATVELAIIRIP
jgi:hypothetical protein